ncbi:MAG TPA: serine-type D-Ala-D-Ala carboxypeptidase, partial [Gammaproteobacteria bacterium]|nr:serine-type D-Ala-D-Ala carboxypeptidase [Gammaproteobacteria bacterium]
MKYQLLIKKISTLFIVAISITSLNLQAAIFITPKQPSINAASYAVLDYNSGAII